MIRRKIQLLPKKGGNSVPEGVMRKSYFQAGYKWRYSQTG
jgi:hypothetical protein